ncbi:MAG: right-handed parallel beta-helix repeat-containing protein, partial [Planctomycetes bacterium]|nr:right-handed parallel beta-helix repeat-containing protein [Planctomycetota bacterium]
AGWTQHQGAIWKLSGWAWNSQQVFVDGVAQQQIGMPAGFGTGIASDGTRMITPVGSGIPDLAPGRFFYDAPSKVLYLWLADGGDPNVHVIEASAYRRIMFMGSSTFVTVAGVAFRHSSTAAYMVGGAAIELGTDCTLRDCDVQWCDFAGIALGYQQSRSKVIGCVVSNNGSTGISVSATYDFTVSGTTMSANNYRRFNPQWHAGGLKATSKAWGTVERCTVTNNLGSGIWFDYANSGNPIVVRQNWVAGNTNRGAGIMLEVSKRVTVENNVVMDNDIRGIYVSASNDVDILANTIVANRGYHAVDIAGMPRSGASLTNVRFSGNCVSGNLGQRDLFIVKENGTDIVGLRCDNNLFHRPTGVVLHWALDGRGGWAGRDYPSLAAWQEATEFDDASVESDPRFTDGSANDFRLSPASAAIDRGAALPFTVDHLGSPRCVGPYPDLGAYECTVLPPTITSPLTAAATAGAWFSYTIAGSSDPTRFAATGLPLGLELDTRTGEITGFPLLGGQFTATISAGNARGDGSATLEIAINAPPTVALTGPGLGAVVTAPAAFILRASAQDDRGVANVEFYADGAFVGQTSIAPYECAWSSDQAGEHVLTARAIDGDGISTSSTPVTVRVNAPPSVGLTGPGDGGVFTASSAIEIQAIAGDDRGIAAVEFYADGALVGRSSVPPYQCTWSSAQSGMHAFIARAIDSDGASTLSVPMNLRINAPPTVALTGPGDGSAITLPADVVLTADAVDDRAIAAVEFYDGTTLLGRVLAAPFRWTWSSPPVGDHVVTARAIDDDGVASTSAAVSVTVRPVPLFSARVNFQPAASPTVDGWSVDSGSVFGVRAGLSYGWNLATPDSRDRNRIADQLRDTCILMQAAANRDARWEIAVPSGTYQVHVVCGDPSFFDGQFKLDVEGVRAIEGRATAALPFWEGTVRVVVTDGRLTVSNAIGSYNTKICFIEIQGVPTGNG